jgi:hypothetical protein
MVYCPHPCIKTLHAFAQKKGILMQKQEGDPLQEVPHIVNGRNLTMNIQNALLILLQDTASSPLNFSVAAAMCAKPSHFFKKEF